MTVNFHDLPAHVRDRIKDKLPAGVVRGKKDRTVAQGKHPAYRCHTCGELFPAYTKAERHAREAGHSRLCMVIDPDTEENHGKDRTRLRDRARLGDGGDSAA